MCESKGTITAPAVIGGKRYRMTWHMVEAPIPLLWGKKSMKKAGVLLDFSNDRVRINNIWTDLIVFSCDYYRLNILPKSDNGIQGIGLRRGKRCRKTGE